MLATILSIVASLLALLGKIAVVAQDAKQKQAGVDEVLARDAEAEAAASHKAEAVAVEGQTNAQTQADLTAGRF